MSNSYTSNTSLLIKAREVRHLRQWHANSASERVKSTIEVMDALQDLLVARYGLVLKGLKVLDVGTGQQQIQSVWLARHNEVTGIDLDVVTSGWSPLPYLHMLRENGANRTLKTIARKAMGIDRIYTEALRRQLGRTAKGLPVRQMDVTALHLPSDSFDFVYCSSVLQSVPDVEAALLELNRVLRPGGVGYFTVQLYTSESGSLDPRLLTDGKRENLPYWAHLRPEYAHNIAGNAHLNRLRLAEWRQAVAACLPDPVIDLGQPEARRLEPIARSLMEDGALQEFTIEELLTHDLRVSWRKPRPD